MDGKKNSAATPHQVAARELALKVLQEVEEDQSYLNLSLTRFLNEFELSSEDRGLLTELTNGVVQRLNTLDWILSQYLSRPLEKLTPWVRNILRLGAYQILYLQRIPDSAAVDESVKLAHRYGHRGVAGLVNAVLRKVSSSKESLPLPAREEEPELYLSLQYSYPLWLVKRWKAHLGLEEAEELCRAGNERPPLTVRVNTLRCSRGELVEFLQGEGTAAEKCTFAADGVQLGLRGKLTALESFRRGLFQVQGESSMLVAPALSPQPGEKVLDLCSAPGGKTAHIAALMRNQGEIVATDLHAHRLRLVRSAMERLGIGIVNTEPLNGRQIPSEMRGIYDRVLLDVPCSGMGVIRRKADLKWRRSPEDISSLSQLQFELLKGAFQALRPGGVLLYSACTTEPEETKGVVEKFLEEEPAAWRSSFSSLLPELLLAEDEEGMVHLWPHKHGLDGFFLARLRKEGSR